MVAVAVFWTVLIPFVNGLLDYDQTTRAGDVFALGPGITMDARQGWGVGEGLLTSETNASSEGEQVALVGDGGVSFVVTPGPYSGDLGTLLSQIDKVQTALQGNEAFNVANDVQSFQTNDGNRGLAQSYTTVDGVGVVAALKFGDTGLEITAQGPKASMVSEADDLERMIDSISYDPQAAG